MKLRRRRIALSIGVALFLICAAALFARVGGGHSYSGGGGGRSSGGSSYSGSSRSGGTSSGGSGAATCGVLAIFLLIMVVMIALSAKARRGADPSVFQTGASRALTGPPLEALRRFDPNFSQIVFNDFCYALYARVHHARGAGDLARFAPYSSDGVRQQLTAGNPKGLTEVRGIVIGALDVGPLQGLDGPNVAVDVVYDANMTEVVDAGSGPQESSWYVRERWRFERRRDILSPPPEKAKAEHCPRCGAALQTRTDGACEYCGVKISDGAFQWYVRSITVMTKDARGPLLTSDVPEEGTDLPTVWQPGFALREKEFEASHPKFRSEELIARAREIALKLQDAWSARNWERVRPLESETLFQTHRYWIDAYVRQHLRNMVADFRIKNIEPVKVDADPFYDAITVRLWASGRDFTVDENDKVVAGSRVAQRSWSEYWTFIRTRATQSEPSRTVSCPNCGASVEVGPTGVCRFCGGKLGGGEFGWVLSRIEQDEAYSG